MAGPDSDEGWSSVAGNGGGSSRERDEPWALVVLGWNRPQSSGDGDVEVPSLSEVLSRSSEIRYVSPTLTSILGYSPDELAQRNLLELLHPDDLDVAATEFVRLLEEERIPRPMSIRARHHEGHWVDLEVLVTNMLDDPAVEGFVANVRDDTEHKRVEAELAEAEERFRMAFEQAPIGKSLSDLNGRILRVNRSLAQMFGRAPDEIEGLTIRDLTHPEDWPKTEEAIQQLVSGAIDDYEMEKRFLHADGHPVWAVLSVGLVRDPVGRPLYMIVQLQDVTERKLLGEQLEHAALHDELTGLPNRTSFTQQLQEELNRTDTNGDAGLVAVLFIDLDNFKLVSDSFGYAAGDELLLIFAERLKDAALATDMVARFGGDEFTVLCRGVRDEAEAVEIAERIVDCLARPAFLSTGEVFVTVSAGVAVQGRSPQDADTLIRDADAAMYRAKQLGRARVQISDAHDRERAVEHLRTGTLLHHALERNEFRLHYQPLVSLESGRIVAVEGLLRWQHPERGLVPPSDFVGVAEETSLITPIGKWVFGAACYQLAEWQARGGTGTEFAVSTNLSVRQLIDSALPSQVARILAETGVDANSFWVEITEATVMQDVESAIGALHALREIGVHLLIDDFGTGYSSMSYLKRLPVEALKIDQTFIAGLGSDPDDTAIVSACVGLARALGFTSIAEGVETPAQLAALRALGCEVAQGYLFAAPRSAAELGDAPPDKTDSWSTEWPLPEHLAG